MTESALTSNAPATPLIYLASPYSAQKPDGSADLEVMEARCQAVAKYAAGLMAQGMHIFSPICHTHHITRYGLPSDWQYWQHLDVRMLSHCDAMIVLMLPGWEDSKGVAAETAIMRHAGKPIEWHAEDGRCACEEHYEDLRQKAVPYNSCHDVQPAH